jgi:hypothetical protein
MATCPKCFQEKPAFSPHCPHCTQRIKAGEEIEFAILEWVIGIVLLVVVFGFLFG